MKLPQVSGPGVYGSSFGLITWKLKGNFVLLLCYYLPRTAVTQCYKLDGLKHQVFILS